MEVASSSAIDTFFDEIKKVGFFARLFSWGRIRGLSYDASNEVALLRSNRDSLNQQIDGLNKLLESEKRDTETRSNEVARLNGDLTKALTSLGEVREQLKDREVRIRELETSTDSNKVAIADLKAEAGIFRRQIDDKNAEITNYEGKLAEATTVRDKNGERVKELETDLVAFNRKLEDLDRSIKEKDKTITQYQSVDQSRLDEHTQKMAELQTFLNGLKDDKARLEQEREEALKAHLEDMKKTWSNHERKVEEAIKVLCKKHSMEYLSKEKVPFKGKPDNTVKICQEYVIFDAKSPEGDNLTNFTDYIKKQSEDVQKYTKEENVKRDIFLVVPSNTIHLFDEYSINHGDFKVYIVTVDSLEPIILSLKKIEEYEFVEQLSPEERDDICHVIGRLSHLTKRRIQVDSFFCEESFKALKECGCLPEEFSEKMLVYERSTKLNPPVEHKVKSISDKELQKFVDTVRKDSDFLGIETSDKLGDEIKKLPLLKESKEEHEDK